MTNLSPYAQQIRDRLKVSELIGRDLKLSRKGNEFSGLCPFHHEKTPSFTVNDHKGFYHCFGCGAHGDVINYIMQRQNLDFQLAVKELAELVGIKIQATKTSFQPSSELYQILEYSCQWFQDNLQRSIGETARAYLKERGFNKETQEL
jgi:DNA primase